MPEWTLADLVPLAQNRGLVVDASAAPSVRVVVGPDLALDRGKVFGESTTEAM
jgi:hypothetical protein